SAGNLLWTRTYGGSLDEVASSIIQTKDKGYAVAGWTDTYGSGQDDIYFLKLDSAGNSCSAGGTGGVENSGGIVGSGGVISNGGSASSGGSVSSGGIYNILCSPTSINELSSSKRNARLYPDPNKGVFTIQLSLTNSNPVVEIYNMLGEKVYNASVHSANAAIDISNNPSGIYMYRVLSDKGDLVSLGKFIIQK
ncbi:MAG: T9SS type A sorting domain-containing protein, partial [Patescibacteria group bacterium]|nr:T9SS type A sorting domain-containing protein [Patescibacteria group bacterium]